MNKGLFITFEGIDGCGKSTQVQLLKDHIQANKKDCYSTFEPSSGPIGSLLRQCLTRRVSLDESSMAALFAADRLDHITNHIDGMLDKINNGTFVICDRYILSNYAYQGVKTPIEWVKGLNDHAASLLKADFHFFIDVTPETALSRINSNRDSSELFETSERLTAVRDKYLELIEELKDEENIIVIDGNKTPSQISDDIWKIISQNLK